MTITKRSKRMLAVAGVAIAALTLSACSPDSTATPSPQFTGTTGPITIGFSPMNQQAEALIGLAHGVQAMAESQGNKVVIADPNNDPATQASQITAWISNKQVQAFWSLAASAPALTSVLKLAQSSGVVALVNGVPKDYGFDGLQAGISFAVIDYSALGTNVGKDLSACIASRGANSSKELIFVTSPAGQVGADDQIAALKKAIADSGATIVTEVAGEANQATSQAAVSSALQAHPNAIGVFGWNDEATLGAVQAVKAAGKNPNNMCIAGAGGGDPALAAVTDGSIYGVAALDFAADMAQNLAQITKMAANPSAVGVQLTTPVKNSVTTVNP